MYEVKNIQEYPENSNPLLRHTGALHMYLACTHHLPHPYLMAHASLHLSSNTGFPSAPGAQEIACATHHHSTHRTHL